MDMKCKHPIWKISRDGAVSYSRHLYVVVPSVGVLPGTFTNEVHCGALFILAPENLPNIPITMLLTPSGVITWDEWVNGSRVLDVLEQIKGKLEIIERMI